MRGRCAASGLGAGLGLGALVLAAAPARGDDAAADRIERRTPTVLVTAVRPAELPEAPTSFTSVVETREFEGEDISLERMVERVPGVQVRRFGGPGQPAEIAIRGSTSSQVVVLLDGVRLNTAQSGPVDLSSIPTSLVERVEVSRGGGGSIRTGSDAIGGVVNIVTRRPGATPHTDLVGAFGSFGLGEASASQTGRLGELELGLGYDFFQSEGDFEFSAGQVIVDGQPPVPDLVGQVQRVNNAVENHAGLVSLGRDLGERLYLSFRDSVFYGSAGRPGPAFGPGVVAQQSLTAHQWRTRNLADLSLEATGLTRLGLDGDFQLFHRYDRSRFQDPEPPQGAAVDSDNRNYALGGRAELVRQLRLGPSQHAPSLGLELRGDWLDSKTSGHHDRATVGVFLEDDVELLAERLRLVPALRFDHTGGFGAEWLPHLGALVSPRPWLRFKANAGRSYRVPNFDELYLNEGSLRGNPSLRPEQAWDLDAGVELGFARLGPLDALRLEIAGFHREIDESIVFQLVSSNVVAATNTGPARVTGFELGGGVALGWLAFDASYTWLDSEQTQTGAPLPGRPDQEYDLRLVLEPPSGLFKLVGERVTTSAIPANFGGGTVIPGRTVYHASAVLDLARIPQLPQELRLRPQEVLLSVNGTNLTDQAVRDAQGFPQPGRMFVFRLEVGW